MFYIKTGNEYLTYQESWNVFFITCLDYLLYGLDKLEKPKKTGKKPLLYHELIG